MGQPSIDIYTFDSWDGELRNNGYSYTAFEQVGVAGFGYLYGALKTKAQRIVTIARIDNFTDAQSALAGYRAMMPPVGTIGGYTVVDPPGTTWNSVTVVDVDGVIRIDPIGPLVFATWLLMPTSV